MAGPGIAKGRTDALVYLMDILPTICELTGTPVPDGLDGKSFKPVIDGRARSVRDSIFMSYRDCQRGIRDGRWKLIRYPQVNVTQLFDLQTDPDELNNLSADPAQAERVQKMMAQLAERQKHYADTCPLTSATSKPSAFVPPTGEALDALLQRWKMK